MYKILDLISSLHPLKKWSERRDKFFRKHKVNFFRKILVILRFLSGNDLNTILKDFFRTKKYPLGKPTRERCSLKKIIRHINERIKPKNKHFYLRSLRTSGFSDSECRDLGFKFGYKLWLSCLNQSLRNSGGRPGLNPGIIESINAYCEDFSEISSYRIATQKSYLPIERKNNEVKIFAKPRCIKSTVNCRYFLKTKSQLQKNFPWNETVTRYCKKTKSHKEYQSPAKSTFFKHMNKKFKKARKQLDMCEFCLLSDELKIKINDFIRFNYELLWEEEFNLNKYITHLGKPFETYQNLMEIPPEDEDTDEEMIAEEEYLKLKNKFDQEISEENIEDDEEEINQAHVNQDQSENVIESTDDNSNEGSVTVIRNELNINTRELNSTQKLNSKSLKENNTNISFDNLASQLDIVKQIEYHQYIAKRQRYAYNIMTTDPSYYHDSILIEFDYQQKLVFCKILL